MAITNQDRIGKGLDLLKDGRGPTPSSSATLRRGAFATRLVLVVLCLMAAQWLLGEHHVPTFWQVGLSTMFVCWSAFVGALLWVLYVAPGTRAWASSPSSCSPR